MLFEGIGVQASTLEPLGPTIRPVAWYAADSSETPSPLCLDSPSFRKHTPSMSALGSYFLLSQMLNALHGREFQVT